MKNDKFMKKIFKKILKFIYLIYEKIFKNKNFNLKIN
jgi:hypothetical protein